MEFKTTTTSRQHQTSSFLNTNRKVTDVHDVLNRMRNADNGKFCIHFGTIELTNQLLISLNKMFVLFIFNAVTEDGDTEEDKEARALLNKFLGASVLMSGMESMVPREITTIVGAPSSQKQVSAAYCKNVCTEGSYINDDTLRIFDPLQTAKIEKITKK